MTIMSRFSGSHIQSNKLTKIHCNFLLIFHIEMAILEVTSHNINSVKTRQLHVTFKRPLSSGSTGRLLN